MAKRTPAVPKLESNRIILDAVHSHIEKTGQKQKVIALDAGLEANYISMIKGSSRPALKRVVVLKNAMPNLDDVLLTATILSEMHPEEDSQDAILRLVEFMTTPPAFERAILDLAQNIRENEGSAGLQLPTSLPDDIKTAIIGLLREAVQRETRAAMAE